MGAPLVWMTSTKLASAGSNRIPSDRCSKSGSAGSMPKQKRETERLLQGHCRKLAESLAYAYWPWANSLNCSRSRSWMIHAAFWLALRTFPPKAVNWDCLIFMKTRKVQRVNPRAVCVCENGHGFPTMQQWYVYIIVPVFDRTSYI